MTRWTKKTELNPRAPEDLAIQWAVVRMGGLELSSFFFFLVSKEESGPSRAANIEESRMGDREKQISCYMD